MRKNETRNRYNSYYWGWTDEGISDALGKTPGFKYSETFLRRFYTEE